MATAMCTQATFLKKGWKLYWPPSGRNWHRPKQPKRPLVSQSSLWRIHQPRQAPRSHWTGRSEGGERELPLDSWAIDHASETAYLGPDAGRKPTRMAHCGSSQEDTTGGTTLGTQPAGAKMDTQCLTRQQTNKAEGLKGFDSVPGGNTQTQNVSPPHKIPTTGW
ncbi:Hypothetical predicted protein [Pelobates cultripes]|uniref:Uncharacterized protein n=1 Tax=Pelobates cultripes TaxID=61616 RepID=A0AAD1S604_PELCU|nr:Hypothetical predicted protein [Pelobates cultripes]